VVKLSSEKPAKLKANRVKDTGYGGVADDATANGWVPTTAITA
jgi:hypothetical protein